MSDYLPDSVVDQILLKLPHTSLVRFCSVCKPWRSLIASHSFNVQHSFFNPTPSLLLTRHSTHWSLSNISHFPSLTITQLEPPYRNATYPSSSFRFLQSLHGLVCLAEQFPRNVHAVILWNPSIRRHIRIEAPTLRHAEAIGFGFDSKNHDFKVIRIVNSHQVELYSLNQGAWRVIDVCHTQELDLSVKFSDTPHFLNGNVHWMVYDADIYLGNRNILMFNVEEEKFKKIELPPKLVKAWFMNMKMTVIEGCLCVLNCKHRRDWCDIWMMREYGVAASWTKMYSFSIVGGRGPSSVFGLSTSAKLLVLKQDPAERERAYFSLHSFTRTSEEISFFDIEGEAISVCEYTPGSLVLLDKA